MQIGLHSHLAWKLQQELTERLKFTLNYSPTQMKAEQAAREEEEMAEKIKASFGKKN